MNLNTYPVNNDIFRDLVESVCNIEHGPWVAGGSVRKIWQNLSWENQDIDFFFKNKEQYDWFNSVISTAYNSIKVLSTNNAITYHITIPHNTCIKFQAIHKRWYNNVQEVLSDFDFTITQFASDGVTILASSLAVQDCSARKIKKTPTRIDKINPARVVKYSLYGFEPSSEIMLNVIKSIHAGDSYDLDY